MSAPRSAIGMLMHEHQLILRMIEDMRWTIGRLEQGAELEEGYVATAFDFIRSYADRCHHGKEEGILFRDMAAKPLRPEDAAAMQRLMDEHIWARGTTARMVESAHRYAEGDGSALNSLIVELRNLVEFYPRHIDSEDHGFFRQVNQYFTSEEREAMAQECREFDSALVHERYIGLVERLEARREREEPGVRADAKSGRMGSTP